MGDMKLTVRKERRGSRATTGTGKKNKNGERLVGICAERHMHLVNTINTERDTDTLEEGQKTRVEGSH